MHAYIEAILFVEAKPISLQRLAKLLNQDIEAVKTAVEELRSQYINQQRGLRIVVTEKEVQITTAAEVHDVIAELVKDERTGELTTPSIETLAIIAYRSPVTKAEIESIRGVNCGMILRNLLIRGLITETIDKERSIAVYDITPEYLQLLGASSVRELPDYEQLHRDITLEEQLGEMENSDDFFQQVKQAGKTD